MLGDDRRKIPDGISLAQWYKEHADQLRTDQTDGAREQIVANSLLPEFEKSPASWEAISYLNEVRSPSFQAYLQNWYDRAPPVHKPFIARMAEQFGIQLAIRGSAEDPNDALKNVPVPPP